VHEQISQLQERLSLADAEVSRLQLSLAARDNSVSSVHSEHTREMELLQKRLRELELDLAACQVESLASAFDFCTNQLL